MTNDPLKVRQLMDMLNRHREATEFDRDGLGDDILDATTDLIFRDFEAGITPDGSPWDELSPAYEAYKQKYYITAQMGYADMAMAGDRDQFKGSRFVSATTARASFGITDEAVEEAEYFQIDRPFWGLNPERIAASVAVAKAHLEKKLR